MTIENKILARVGEFTVTESEVNEMIAQLMQSGQNLFMKSLVLRFDPTSMMVLECRYGALLKLKLVSMFLFLLI